MRKHEDLAVTYDTLEDTKLYPVRVFRRILKEKGLPNSMYSIMSWERKGLIPSPRSNLNKWRFYLGKEIKAFIEKVGTRSEANH